MGDGHVIHHDVELTRALRQRVPHLPAHDLVSKGTAAIINGFGFTAWQGNNCLVIRARHDDNDADSQYSKSETAALAAALKYR